jgi:EAL domain-containing protein (putative c-di-GMP-specific phosphodiesterase class I)
MAERLILALQKDEFALYAQDIVSLGPRKERPFQEIFVRFKEEDDKLIPPGDFFGVLEEHRLLPQLDRWVVNCLARWVRSGLSVKPDWEVPRSNVNLSSQTFNDPDYLEYVRAFVEGPFLDKGAVAFEIGVDNAFDYQDFVAELITTLQSRSSCITLAGFNGSDRSIEMLKAFAPDFVKIAYNAVAAGELFELVQICRVFRSRTIVEFVESQEALHTAQRAQADFAQGFGIAAVQPLLAELSTS